MDSQWTYSYAENNSLILHIETFGTFFMNNSWSWRIPSAVQALPSVLQLFLIWFVPESPRWLVSNGREEEARRILGYWHGNGNELVIYFMSIH